MRFLQATPCAIFVVAAIALAGCSDQSEVSKAELAGGPEPQVVSSDGRNALYIDGPQRSGDLEIGATSLAYLYHRMSGEPASIDRMMTKPLNLRFDDEFARRRFLEENFDEFAKSVQDVVAAKTYTVTLSGKLEGYDFDREGFAIGGLYDRTMVTFSADKSGSEGLDFALALEDTGKLAILPMSSDDAEVLSGSLKNLAVDLEVAFTPVEAGWEKVRNDQMRTVIGKAYRVKVLSSEGNVIGTINSNERPSTSPLKLYADNPFDKEKLTNPWMAENAPEAVLDHYAWIIDEQWKMSNDQERDKMEEALSMVGGSANGCISQFGYSQCKRLAERRRNFIARCIQTVPERRKQECYSIDSLPYTEQEANAL